ncbi:MAG: purine-binding chemotaxis protein CheW [Comamonas sp.]|nr:purine-binding chemotaxis protein CheW [Candidatus Comamonas equi]
MHATTSTATASTGSLSPAQYLTFLLGGDAYAMGILSIKEIIEYTSMTEVPLMPECIRGVINLRGAVVPVMDLQVRFGQSASAVSKKTCIVIVEVDSAEGQQVMGVVVDAVSEVIDIHPDDIEPAPAFGAQIRSDFICGMAKVRGKFVILLDVNHVLNLDDLQSLSQALPSSETPATA